MSGSFFETQCTHVHTIVVITAAAAMPVSIFILICLEIIYLLQPTSRKKHFVWASRHSLCLQ